MKSNDYTKKVRTIRRSRRVTTFRVEQTARQTDRQDQELCIGAELKDLFFALVDYYSENYKSR